MSTTSAEAFDLHEDLVIHVAFQDACLHVLGLELKRLDEVCSLGNDPALPSVRSLTIMHHPPDNLMNISRPIDKTQTDRQESREREQVGVSELQPGSWHLCRQEIGRRVDLEDGR
eukprot:753705-Hanusia_phi.AAC.4